MRDRRPRTRALKSLTHKYATVVGTVLVLAVGILFVVRTVDPGKVLSLLSAADPLLLGAALVVYLLSWPLRGRRYGDVLAVMDRRFGTRFLTLIVFASQTANLVVPARAGDGVRAYLLHERRDVTYPTGVASLAVERAFDLVALATLGGIAFVFLLFDARTVTAADASVGVTVAVGVGVGVAVTLLSVLTVGIARSDRTFGPAIRNRVRGPRLSKVVDAATRFGASVRVVADSPRSIGTIYAGSAAVWILDVLTAILVLAALIGTGGGVTGRSLLAVGTLAVSVGNLAKVLPLSQGGIGLYEAAFTGLVVGVTPISVEAAMTAAILDHALKNAVTLVGGGLAAVTLQGSPTTLTGVDEVPKTGSSDF